MADRDPAEPLSATIEMLPRDAMPTVELGVVRMVATGPIAPSPVIAPSTFDPPADRFEPVGELGRGGMGYVVDAVDRALGRKVALKQMISTTSHDLARFDREARITARLEHPSIVPLYDVGRTSGGAPYYVMRRVDGSPLGDLVRDRTLVERLALIPNVLAVCDAVAYAHARGIIHRDIKPPNILVGPFGETLLIDWGLARELVGETGDAVAGETSGDRTRAGVVTGTPGFMAPEQARGDAVDRRADVYALGATLYYVLTGCVPHASHDASVMIERVSAGVPPDWQHVPDSTPVDLRAIVVKAMAGDREARYPDASALAADLRRFLTGQLVGAYRYGRLARLRRFARRHRGTLIVAALGVAILTAVIAFVVAATPPTPVTTTVAVAPLRIDIASYGTEQRNPDVAADVLALLLGQLEGGAITGITVGQKPSGPETREHADRRIGLDHRPSAQAIHATYLLTGSITEVDTTLHGTLVLVEVASGKPIKTVEASRPSPQVAPLLDDLVRKLADAIQPGATLTSGPNPLRAQVFYRPAEILIQKGRFTEARPYLEQAVDADPIFFDAWYGLALTLGWNDAPEKLVLAATANARRYAPPGPKKQLMDGVAAFLEGDYPAARLTLEAIAQTRGPSSPDQRELLYFLGEANWHDGHHAEAFDYFKRTLAVDPQFTPAAVHAMQYTIARRDAVGATRYIGLVGDSPQWVQLMERRYDELAVSGSGAFKLWAKLVRGLSPSTELPPGVAVDSLEGRVFRIARVAGAGDLGRVRTDVASLWATLATSGQLDRPDAGVFYQLEILGEILIAAELKPETRHLVSFLAKHAKHHAVRGYQRLSILAAALLGDATLIPADLSYRNTLLATAATAELAGDRAKAAEILTALIADPLFVWDYAERAALARVLRALGRSSELVALCADTMSPAIFRPAFLVLQHTCAGVK